jgi:hypothetical protein
VTGVQRKVRMKPPPQLAPMKELQVWGVWVDDVEYRAIVSRDELVPGDDRWHLSISGENDVPPWSVIATIGHDLRPGVPMALGVPPRSWWINVHPHTLHLWELNDENLIDQWRAERRGQTPT